MLIINKMSALSEPMTDGKVTDYKTCLSVLTNYYFLYI